MAGKIQGITVEIGGDASGLQNSLKKANSTITATNKELKEVNKLLKYDPKNTELLTQKQRLLSQQISTTNSKLKDLQKQDQQMQKSMRAGDISVEQYEKFRREIIATEGKLKSYENQLKSVNNELSNSKFEGLIKSFKDVGSAIGKAGVELGKFSLKATIAGVTALTGAIAGLVTASVKSYAEYEQLVGGVETLFEDSADIVKQYANDAYKTAGLSANQYMETVTSFSASLLQSLGGDTAKSAKIADMAITDMSDNANKLGTDMSMIQSAYQGFAKQNYTMLDNLKLGYGGTKTEMERLLADAERFSGIHYDISNLSDVYNAIHVIQEEMGIAGTTAEEAEKTISGSANAMKSAWQNMITGIASGDNNFDRLINNLIKSVEKFAKNIIPVIKRAIRGAVDLIKELLPILVEELPKLIKDILPVLIESAINLFKLILQGIVDNADSLVNGIVLILNSLVGKIIELLPLLLQAVITLTIAVIQGLAKALPDLLPKIIEAILQMIPILIDNLPLFIEAGWQLITGLLEGIIKAVPKILEYIPIIIKKIIDLFLEMPGKLVEIGVNLVEGLWDGIKGSFEWIKNKLTEWVGDVLDFIKKLFGIASPSKKTKQDGLYIAQGLANGIIDGLPMVEKAVNKMSGVVDGTLNSNIDINGSKGKGGNIINLTFNAQTLDDAQINKVVKAVNKELGNSY